jgi:hypothetical protein
MKLLKPMGSAPIEQKYFKNGKPINTQLAVDFK